jgi:TetR/AcrR family transcriptional regulator
VPVKDCKTEQHIIDTSMKVFFSEGRINATTQEIADAAGINRTLIHYYFRSKDVLFKETFRQAMVIFSQKSDMILGTDLPFREKTERFITNFMKKLEDYPYLETFISLGIIQQGFGKSPLIPTPKEQPEAIKIYLKEIEKAMEEGVTPRMNPAHFIMNMFSLMIYPFLMEPLQKSLLNITKEGYNQAIKERKEIIMKILFPSK